MGRSPCCEKVGLKKGPWTPEEDHKLLAYIDQHGHGSWRVLPPKAGLERCGKSCRLRWTNYLRSDIKRGKFSLQEEQTIIQLHALLGNRWSAIATHLPKRTDNEIKNYWNTHLKKRLAKMGIDPMTHKSRNNTLISSDGQSMNAANLSHMAQWESARLEAEARLARQSELRSTSNFQNYTLGSSEFSSSSSSTSPFNKPKEWFFKSFNGVWDRGGAALCGVSVAGIGADLESPTTSSLSYSEKVGENSSAFIEFVGNSSIVEEEKEICQEFENSNKFAGLSYTSGLRELTMPVDSTWAPPEQIQTNSDNHDSNGNYVQRFTDLLHIKYPRDHETIFSEMGSDRGDGNGTEYFEDKKNYWNSILNAVNSSPADSLIFEWELTS